MPTEQCNATVQGFADITATSAEKLDYARCISSNAEQSLIEQCKHVTDSDTLLTLLNSKPLTFGLIFVTIAVVAFAMSKIVKKQNNETKLNDR